ncbi:DUF3750 domain-containing protein [Rhizobium metallidurans]|uniref:DUF3750 domain-containing protein n=1 Tax=Rhizobium metallidurans TaxID=1265931 RepID=A0A7W6GC67_9HYPH|nr:DUF3750 domain-containing protein [Rhizobium metallidurans]MBB3965499.1 hypothetical protein [Rhizobium metallidurans]
MRHLKRLLLLILVVYLLPALASAGWWSLQSRPSSWREAEWGTSGVLPKADASEDAKIYIMSASTGGLKGAVASHSWIVTKAKGDAAYNRYDKVGWGSPIRRNNYVADAYWYSNTPRIVKEISGGEAQRLIPAVEAAIQSYPYAGVGDYRIYPGPNSNSFVAHVLRTVPDLDTVLPPDAVGRDYLSGGRMFAIDADGRDMHATLYGLIGIAAGQRSGFEVHFMGLVAGIDVTNPGLKIPAIGRIGL